MGEKKRKAVTAVAAVATAAVIALSGTFAWQSISQRAINETAGSVNPGARLHDDFDGTNKDVYVENFADAADGEPIFARIRLDEYMETGMEAGENRDAVDRKATSVVAGADINDRTTWKTHIPGADDDPFHAYWIWTTGGQTTYMPTFNKNKDSLEADINGTYEGTNPDDDTHYDDYVDYSDPANASKTANAVYDADDNDIDEGESAVEGTNIMTAEETHTAAQTLNGTVMTMQEWQAAGSQPGAYWVYDADGWAYWAQAIQPGTATGLLLDGIELTTHPGENWYYGINAVAQFVTVDDWGAEDNTGFFDLSKGTPPSADALDLLSKASGQANGITVSAENDATAVAKGNSLQFNAATTVLGQTAANQNVTWSVSGNAVDGTTISDAGLLTVAADETATELTVAASQNGVTGTATVAVLSDELALQIYEITPGSANTVSIDGIEWYVLAQENNQALLYSKDILEERQFHDSSADYTWSVSNLRTYLNGTWLSAKSTLSQKAVSTTINTRSTYNGSNFTTTTDKVFLLSEADLYGTQSTGVTETITADARDYTLGVEGIIVPTWMRTVEDATHTSGYYWLRNPVKVQYAVGGVNWTDGLMYAPNAYNGTVAGVRPALWVDLSK